MLFGPTPTDEAGAIPENERTDTKTSTEDGVEVEEAPYRLDLLEVTKGLVVQTLAYDSGPQEFTISAGEQNKSVTYGNDQNIFLNGLVFNWKDPQAQSMQTDRQEVIATGVAPTFDWVLNTHSKITINSVSNLDITATN